MTKPDRKDWKSSQSQAYSLPDLISYALTVAVFELLLGYKTLPCKDSEKIRKSFTKKIVRSLLDEIILTHFKECNFSGYDAAVFLQRDVGVSISPSTVYASLYSMERKGLLTGHDEDRKRVFRLTELGNLTVQIIASTKEIDRIVTAVLAPAKVS